VIGPEAQLFWNVIRSVGTSAQIGLFRGPLNDWPHLQNWSDAGVDMADRLADLLTRSGTMQWTGSNQRYQCDLGFGGPMFQVGTAAQIWNRQATITTQMLTQGQAAAAATFVGPPTPITQAAVTAMRAELRRQFELADANWEQWTSH
jgi:hypothetical protein